MNEITFYDKYNVNVLRDGKPLPTDLSKAHWYYYRFNCGLLSLQTEDYIPLKVQYLPLLQMNGPQLAFSDDMIMTEFEINL